MSPQRSPSEAIHLVRELGLLILVSVLLWALAIGVLIVLVHYL